MLSCVRRPRGGEGDKKEQTKEIILRNGRRGKMRGKNSVCLQQVVIGELTTHPRKPKGNGKGHRK